MFGHVLFVIWGAKIAKRSYLCAKLKTNKTIMQPDFTYNRVPPGFGHCFANDCRQAGTCMRRLTVPLIPSNLQTVTVVNPSLIRPSDASCPFYLKDETVRFAQGMTRTFDAIEHSKVTPLRHALINYFGRASYYRCEIGERYILPNEQKDIADIFHRYGVGEPVYDRYVDMYEWETIRLRRAK
jgi:hypothetical protein